jgi:hypothetical protein
MDRPMRVVCRATAILAFCCAALVPKCVLSAAEEHQLYAQDPLRTLLSRMAPGQAIHLNAHGPERLSWGMAVDMAVNRFAGDMPGLIAYFDGGSTFNARFPPNNNVVGGVGNGTGSELGGQWAYTRPTLDYARMKLFLFGGGHNGGGDGSGYEFDVLAAAASLDANPTAKTHYTIVFKSARYIPAVLPQPDNSTNAQDPHAILTTLATWRAGSTHISVADFGWKSLEHNSGRLFIAGPGVARYTYITGQPTSNPITVANDTVSPRQILSGSGGTIRISINYWALPNQDGLSPPISSHSYFANTWIPGTEKFALGGGAAFGMPPGHAMLYSVWDDHSKTFYNDPNCVGGVNRPCFGAQAGGGFEPVHYCPADDHFYTYEGNRLMQVTGLATHAIKRAVSVIGGQSNYVYAVQTVMFMDPDEPSKCEVWQQLSANRNGTERWGMFAGIGRGSTPVWKIGTVTDVPTTDFNRNQSYFSDGTYTHPGRNILIWTGDSKVYQITPTRGSIWHTTIVAGQTSGDAIKCVPTHDEESTMGFDLGEKYGHALLLWSGDGGQRCLGDIFLLKR